MMEEPEAVEQRINRWRDEAAATLARLPAHAQQFAEWCRPMVLLYGRCHAERYREEFWLQFVRGLAAAAGGASVPGRTIDHREKGAGV